MNGPGGQRKTNTICFHLYVESKNNINEQTKQKQMNGCQMGVELGG